MSTIKAVAERAGVSTATVSRTLSHPQRVQADTRARVQAAVAALGYAPNAAAMSLRRLRTGKLLVMVPDIANPFFAEVLRGAEDAAQAAGYSVLLGDTRGDPERETQYAQMLGRKEADGLIFLGPRVPDVLARAVAGGEAPVVNGCDFSPSQGVSSAHIDNARAARDVMGLLYSMGHRRIGLVAGQPGSFIAADRLKGARECAEGQGLAAALVVAHGDYSIESGRREAARMLARPEPPTAIFCFSDEMAVGALAAVRERGLACPRDVSVVGFDDVHYAAFLDPPLTTVRQPMNRLGAETVRLLLQRIDGGETEVERVTLPHELVVRASTGSAPPRI